MSETRTVVGVVADTHVPDRVKSLPPGLLPALAQAGVSAILHAGDISGPSVLRALEEVAPVTAVGGNRDFLIRPALPSACQITLGGVPVGLAHGHGGMLHYILDKWLYFTQGYSFERYRNSLLRRFPQARVIIFGHIHRIINQWEGHTLLFNPGAAYPCSFNHYTPSIGLLYLGPGQDVSAEVIRL